MVDRENVVGFSGGQRYARRWIWSWTCRIEAFQGISHAVGDWQMRVGLQGFLGRLEEGNG